MVSPEHADVVDDEDDRVRVSVDCANEVSREHSRHRALSSACDSNATLSRRSKHGNDEQAQEWLLFAELMSDPDQRPQTRYARAGPSPGQTLIPSISGLDRHLMNDGRSCSSDNEYSCRPVEHQTAPKQPESLAPPSTAVDPPSNSRRSHWLTVSDKDVLRCSLAYFIASLFTYAPPLAKFLANLSADDTFPLGHLVATVAVYFNPAKTVGAMLEADAYCVAGFIYSALVSLTSMSLYWLLESQRGWEWLADAAVIIMVAASTGFIAWAKVWMNKPSFNTACSMMVIIIFTVVVKEGGLLTLLHVASTVLLGATVSNCVCFLLWSRSATYMLRGDIVKTLDSFAILLDVLKGKFLLDVDRQTFPQKLQAATEAHQMSFTTLKKNLLESKSEWRVAGKSTIAYDDAVTSLNRLAQHLGGLRSGTQRQAELVTDEPAQNINPLDHVSNNANARDTTITTVDFRDHIKDLISPVHSLSSNCTRTLHGMRDIFSSSDTSAAEFDRLTEELQVSLKDFAEASDQGVIELFQRIGLCLGNSKHALVDVEVEEELLFLVYFFVFTLQQFAEELIILVGAIGRIYVFETFYSRRTWLSRLVRCGDIETSQGAKSVRPRLKRSLSTLGRLELKRDSRYFPDIRPHAPNTAQMPARSSLSVWGRFKQSLWIMIERLRESDKLYALKVGVATGVLAGPAFFDITRPAFTHYRGEWALISFFVVLSPTIGATNFLGAHRLGGTLLGAGTAYVLYWCFPHNAVVLSVFGALFSWPCFWLIIKRPTYSTSGRFILLTYNLTCLYSYNRRFDPISIGDIAKRRIVAVGVGVLWALFVSRFWWPSWARRELSKNLSELCANLGWYYTKLITAYTAPAQYVTLHSVVTTQGSDELNPLLPERRPLKSHVLTTVGEFQDMELHLQLQLIKLQNLLAQTQHEPRLKGPFPIVLYRSVLASLQTILDQLHSARCVTIRDESFASVRHDFIIPVNQERRDMVGNVVLYFSILSSAFRLKTPLAPYLPPAEQSRKRVVAAIRNLPIVKRKNIRNSRELLYFAYVLTMKSVIEELDFLGRTLQDAFGVIGQRREDFDRLFTESQHVV